MAFNFDTFGQTPETTQNKSGGFDFNTFGTTQETNPNITADQKSAQTYGATFPAVTGESPLKAGLKALGNIPSSAIGLVKGIGSAILHPIQTIKGIGGVAVGGVQKLIPGQQAQEEQFNQFTTILKDRYGSLENLQRTATNDPFGFGTDILGVLQGGAAIAGKTAQLNKVLSAVAKTVTKPVAKTAGAITKGVQKTTKFGVSQATGLNPETITNIIDNPQAFSQEALKTATRQNLGSSVKEAIDTRLDNLSDIGSGYNTIRETPSVVTIPQGTVESVLNKYGIKVVDGKVKITAEAKPLTSADKIALEDFINVYGNEQQLSSNAFLNARQGLSQLSKYDAAKTGNLTPIARELRGIYDDFGKTQIKGLKELDELYAPEVKQLSQIKKDYLTPTGEFKDGAINKIANLTGVGKEQVLNRLEKIVPGVEQRIKIVKAAEDIEKASGLKVGTYARGALQTGALVFGAATGNIPVIITAIVSSPEIAVKLLKAYGYTNKTAQPIIKTLYGMANDVNNFRLPGQFQKYVEDYIKNPKLGMSIEDITQRTEPPITKLSTANNNIQPKTSNKNIPPNISQPKVESSIIKGIQKTDNQGRLYSEGKVKLDDLTLSEDGISTAKYNISQGNLSKTREPITVFIDKDTGQKSLISGYHRFIEAKNKGLKELDAKYYYGKLNNDNVSISPKTEFLKSTQSSLLQEAKKYKTAEEFVNNQNIIYHGTPEKFSKFDTLKSEGNATWFTADKNEILSGKSGAVQGQGQKMNIMERYVKPNLKLATPEQANKLYTDQLIGEGYRGVKYPAYEGQPEWTKLFYPNEDTITKSQLTDIWKKANKK